MVMITKAGERAGLTAPGTADRITRVLELYHLPVSDKADLRHLMEATASDKKSTGSSIRIVLLRDIGESFVQEMDREEFLRFCGVEPEE